MVAYLFTPSSPIGQCAYHSLLLLVTYLHTHTLLSYWSMRIPFSPAIGRLLTCILLSYWSKLISFSPVINLLVTYLHTTSSPIGQSSSHSLLLLVRYSEMVGTVNSRKLKGGVFKKIVAAKAAAGGTGFEFTVRDTAVRNIFIIIRF